ncbi:hypothetical protein QL285_029318 [Trifolium repens]|nr:hypothetical protein QL285_029318 [Trifolium repens]
MIINHSNEIQIKKSPRINTNSLSFSPFHQKTKTHKNSSKLQSNCSNTFNHAAIVQHGKILRSSSMAACFLLLQVLEVGEDDVATRHWFPPV